MAMTIVRWFLRTVDIQNRSAVRHTFIGGRLVRLVLDDRLYLVRVSRLRVRRASEGSHRLRLLGWGLQR